MQIKKIISLGSLFLLAGLLQACEGGNSGTSDNGSAANSAASASQAAKVSKYDLNLYPVNKLVCDPMATDAANPAINGGLKVDLAYLGANQSRVGDVADMFSTGYASKQILFFTDLNVPTRNFGSGFTMQNNEMVMDDQNNELTEWFGLHFESTLHLAPDQEEGFYQFALLADDGAIFQIQDGGGNWQTIVNDDGTHPTQMACATQTIALSRTSAIPMQVSYYQGPRYQIALTLIMRKVGSLETGVVSIPSESLCGQSGNYLFFDPDHNSAPQPGYAKLLADGWAPLEPANFVLTNQAVYNPCVQGQTPLVSNVQISNVTSTSFEMTWSTDIAASSQVTYQQGAAASQITTSDNVLRVQHDVVVTGLTANTAYSVQPVSISDSFGQTIGAAQTVQSRP